MRLIEKCNVILCSHMYNMLVQHTTCRGRCNMQIRNLFVYDTSKGSLHSNNPTLVGGIYFPLTSLLAGRLRLHYHCLHKGVITLSLQSVTNSSPP